MLACGHAVESYHAKIKKTLCRGKGPLKRMHILPVYRVDNTILMDR